MNTKSCKYLSAPAMIILFVMASVSHGASSTGSKLAEGALHWAAKAGLGYDSNVYLSPADPYVDFAQAGNPTVVPDVQSGFFVPLVLDAEYALELNNDNSLIGSYRFDGDYYLESGQDNANEYTHLVSLGENFVLEQQGVRRNTLFGGIFFGRHRDIYYDRDTGFDQVSGAQNIGERYTYNNLGVEAIYKNRVNEVQFGLEAKLEKRNYEDPGLATVSEYDHNYYHFGGDVEFVLAPPMKLKLGYNYSARDYSDRPARSLDGRALTSNPRLEYSYHSLEASLRNRLNKEWVIYFDYRLKLRDDKFVGYNDYSWNKFRVRGIYTMDKDLRMRMALSYWDRDYPNAFAFDEPIAGEKKYDALEAQWKTELTQTAHRTLWVEIKYWDRGSSDKRYDYERYQAIAGAKWDF